MIRIVLVAAVGPLFGPGGERGVYKTMDGGRTWKRTLAVDDETGATDLVMVPGDPRTYYAATAAGGVWKSSDGGTAWKPPEQK